MANIRVDLDFPIIDGSEAVFIAPCDCSDIAGLVVYYPSTIGANATTRSKEFIFKDAHGSDLSGMDHLFKTGVYVKVLLNVTEGIAYIQNADTNSYIEGKFSGIVIAVNTSKWVKQDDGTYTNTVAAEQIVEGDLLDASLYGEYTEEQAEAFDFLIESIEAQNGKVVFTASEKIEVSLSILLRGRVNMEEKNVFVHDLKAASIEYDNTKSGLKATNPQDAIDELVTSINGLVVVVTTDGWNTQDDGTFRKIIPVEQITGNETFDISLYPGDIPTEEQVIAFSEHVTSIETSEGAIILTASEKINVQFRIFLCGKINFDNNVVLMKEYSAVDIAFDDTVAKLGAKNIQEADVALALRPVNNNILINSNFANPVNQREFTELTVSEYGYKYTIDRWVISQYDGSASSTLKIGDGCVVLSGDKKGDGWVTFGQFVNYLEKGTYTLSVKINGKVYSHTFDYNQEDTFETGIAFENDSISIGANAHAHWKDDIIHPFIWICIQSKNLSSANIEWAKLELGDHATPYYIEDLIDTYDKCRRFSKIVPLYGHVCYVDTDTIIANHSFDDWNCGGMLQRPTPLFVHALNILKNNTWQGGLDQWTVEGIKTFDDYFRITYKKASHGIKSTDLIDVFAHIILDAEL